MENLLSRMAAWTTDATHDEFCRARERISHHGYRPDVAKTYLVVAWLARMQQEKHARILFSRQLVFCCAGHDHGVSFGLKSRRDSSKERELALTARPRRSRAAAKAQTFEPGRCHALRLLTVCSSSKLFEPKRRKDERASNLQEIRNVQGAFAPLRLNARRRGGAFLLLPRLPPKPVAHPPFGECLSSSFAGVKPHIIHISFCEIRAVGARLSLVGQEEPPWPSNPLTGLSSSRELDTKQPCAKSDSVLQVRGQTCRLRVLRFALTFFRKGILHLIGLF